MVRLPARVTAPPSNTAPEPRLLEVEALGWPVARREPSKPHNVSKPSVEALS
jgi:hypothetical protein